MICIARPCDGCRPLPRGRPSRPACLGFVWAVRGYLVEIPLGVMFNPVYTIRVGRT